MLKMKMIVQGRVQGVGFRYSVLEHVESSGLKLEGYVCNLPDGSVEIVARGELEDLKQLRRFAVKGPPSADVRSFQEEYDECPNEAPLTEFKIISRSSS